MGGSKFVEVEYVDDVEDDDGRECAGIRAECPDCGATTESFGQGVASLKRCMVLMRDVCECDDALDTFFTCEELEDA